MKLTSPKDVTELLASLKFRPSKTLGQNFLVDGNILRIMLDTAEIGPEDQVLEIGPGLGVLTEGLLARAKRVVAIELDKRLYAYLRERFAGEKNLELIPGDALDADFNALMKSGINKVASNLPYGAGSRILVELFESNPAPVRMSVTVQHEVADRLAAQPGTKKYGLLSVLAQLDYEVEIRKIVAASCFYPAPQVKSAIVSLRRRPVPRELRDRAVFKDLVKKAFSQRRKQIGTILRGANFENAGINPASRPEELYVEDWCRLADEVTSNR